MKTCPVCQAKAFDDAAVCYGCLHRFGDEDADAGGLAADAPTQLLEFRIRFTPAQDPSGALTWTCAIEA